MALNSLVVTMAFHTYLAHVVAKAKDRPMRLLSGSRFFSKTSPSRVRPMCDNPQNVEADQLKGAKRLNLTVQIAFAILIVVFNVVFWTVGIQEYMKPAEEYL